MSDGEELTNIELQNDGDIEIKCQSCDATFIFTEKEKNFFASMGFVTPRYCHACRKERKKSPRNQGEEWKEYYEVCCDSCGKDTRVPFKPVNGRPVFCWECLQAKKTSIGEDGKDPQKSSSTSDREEVDGLGLTVIDDMNRPYENFEKEVLKILNP